MAGRQKERGRNPRQELLQFALGLPGAYEDHPWGETVAKVGKKVFVFLGMESDDGFGLSAKLPQSAGAALMLPFAEPTGYGLGRAGWVTAKFDRNDGAPVDLMRQWILESYRAVAPKKLIAELDRGPSTPAPAKKKAAKKKAAKKKAPAKRKR